MVTLEVKKFAKPSQYEMISTKPNEILYYSDRILPADEIKCSLSNDSCHEKFGIHHILCTSHLQTSLHEKPHLPSPGMS